MEQVYIVAYNSINGTSILSYERYRSTVATVKKNNRIWIFIKRFIQQLQ